MLPRVLNYRGERRFTSPVCKRSSRHCIDQTFVANGRPPR